MWSNDVGAGGGVALADMHERWSKNGAQEFVPGRGINTYGGGPRGPMGPGAGMLPPGAGIGPGYAGMGPGGMPWMRVSPGWVGGPGGAGAGEWAVPPGTGPGFGASAAARPAAPGQQPATAAPPAAPPKSKSYMVAVWNLWPEYDVKGLQEALADFDFDPQHIWGSSAKGAFVLTFEDIAHAKSISVSLDGTMDYLKPAKEGEPVRVAHWKTEKSEWTAKDVPKILQEEGPKFVLQRHRDEQQHPDRVTPSNSAD